MIYLKQSSTKAVSTADQEVNPKYSRKLENIGKYPRCSQFLYQKITLQIKNNNTTEGIPENGCNF